MDINDIREDYSSHPFLKEELPENPYDMFDRWIQAAVKANVTEPTGMSVATATVDGVPSVRIMLLKGYDQKDGFKFYTNYNSRKGLELTQNPRAALGFWWPTLQRQIRIDGNIYVLDSDLSEAYFNSRPIGSRRGAIASPQSQVIPNRLFLENRLKDIEKTENITRPSHWGGYGLHADNIEFWQGQTDRLHDRLCYKLNKEQNWIIERLAP